MKLLSLPASILVIFFTLSFRSNVVLAEKEVGFFIFGDSTVDPGNNNYIETIPENQANYEPYGRNGFFANPTGRFSDGRIIVDYLAEYAKLPLIPAYLDPSADYGRGVNFASGGAGILSTTNIGQGVIDLETQFKYFKEVEKQLEKKLGSVKAAEFISNAVYFFSMGSNDYLGGYLGNSSMQELHLPEEYVGMVIGNLTQMIQELYAGGARKFGFLSLSPLGCLPILRAMNSEAPGGGGCFEQANGLALAHNNALKSVLTSLERLFPDFKHCNSDFYTWLLDRMNNPSNYGLKEGVKACCGTGPYNGLYSCGGRKNITAYEVCENGDEYVWWDSYHPVERIHEQFAGALWAGPPASVGPFNLQELFLYDHKEIIADVVDKVPLDKEL